MTQFHVLKLLGREWTPEILQALAAGEKRYTELQAAVPAGVGTLQRRLKELEREGLVKRELIEHKMVRYRLTPVGAMLARDSQMLIERYERERRR